MYVCVVDFFFFKQKTAYEMRISDWSSDVCSSDLGGADSAEAERREGFEILHVHDGKGEDDEKRQRRDLDDDEKRIDRRRFARADDKEHGNEPGDEHRRQVDHAAVIWPEHQSRRYVYGEGIFDEAHDIARPADRHGRSEEHTS